MKYLDLILKLIMWNLICFWGFIIVAAHFVGEPAIIAIGAFTIGPVVGTIIGIVKYQKAQKIKSLSKETLRSSRPLR